VRQGEREYLHGLCGSLEVTFLAAYSKLDDEGRPGAFLNKLQDLGIKSPAYSVGQICLRVVEFRRPGIEAAFDIGGGDFEFFDRLVEGVDASDGDVAACDGSGEPALDRRRGLQASG